MKYIKCLQKKFKPLEETIKDLDTSKKKRNMKTNVVRNTWVLEQIKINPPLYVYSIMRNGVKLFWTFYDKGTSNGE